MASMPVASGGSHCFETVPIEGKGLGSRAARPIRRGELILEEVPVIKYKVMEASNTIHKQFQQLSRARQEAVMNLFDSNASAGEEKTLQGVYLTNAILCNPGGFDSMLLLTMARFNHSCIPNCELSWDESAGVERMYACADVAVGEELCICYCDPRMPRDERQETLERGYSFTCTCAACSATDVQTSDKRRNRLKELDNEFGDPVSERGAGLVEPGDATSATDQLFHAESAAKEALRLLDAEGIAHGSMRCQAFCFALRAAIAAGNVEAAELWAASAVDVLVLGRGPEHPDTKRLRMYTEDPTEHPACPQSVRDARLAALAAEQEEAVEDAPYVAREVEVANGVHDTESAPKTRKSNAPGTALWLAAPAIALGAVALATRFARHR